MSCEIKCFIELFDENVDTFWISKLIQILKNYNKNPMTDKT